MALQRQLLAWLKGRLTYADYVHAALRVEPDQLVETVHQPTLVIGTQGDLLEDHARAVASSLTAGHLASHNALRPPIATMLGFLDGGQGTP